MIDAILDYYRKNLGVTVNEFKKLTEYELTYQWAQNLIDIVCNSSILHEFRSTSQKIFNISKPDELSPKLH